VKFKDADLIGIPYRVVLGAEKLSKGQAELFNRATRQTELIDINTVPSVVRERLQAGGIR
jgi:prolyl-tRNA synthetase